MRRILRRSWMIAVIPVNFRFVVYLSLILGVFVGFLIGYPRGINWHVNLRYPWLAEEQNQSTTQPAVADAADWEEPPATQPANSNIRLVDHK